MGGSTSRTAQGGYDYSAVPGNEPVPEHPSPKPLNLRHSAHHDGGAAGASLEDEEDLKSVIQFSCSMYYCEEGEGEMTIDVMRLGDASMEAFADWTTKDASAKAGHKYEARSGRVTFSPGETIKNISIPLLDDDSWDATLEFLVVLTGVQGASLGKYLYTCRVKIIDDDVFPTNKHSDHLRNHKAHDIPGFSLMWEYIRMNWTNKAVRRDSIKQVLWDQVKGLYFLLTLYLQMYLVDVVLNPHKGEGEESEEGSERRLLHQTIQAGARLLARALGEEGGGAEGGEEEGGEESAEPWMPLETLIIPSSRHYTAMVVGAMYVIPFALLHLIDLKKCYLCIPGAARKLLQANLLRRFLNYREDMRCLYGDPSEITMAMIRDVVEVVDFGYMKVLEVIRIIGKLSLALIFILAENWMGVLPLLVYPFVLLCFLRCREKKTLETNDLKAERQDQVVSTVNDAICNYRLFADFHLRPVIVDDYEKRIDSYHGQEGIACAVITNNKYLAPWLTTLTIGGYMVVGAYQAAAFGGPLSLGTLLATINVFKEVGAEIQEIYCECLEIQRAFGPLKKICHFMNLETDLPQHMIINRMRRKRGEERRQQVRHRQSTNGQDHTTRFAADDVEIEVTNLSFQYNPKYPPIMSNVSLRFPQGNMYSFVGPPHEGKATLLRLFGHVLLPQDGEIFVPPHLRILHVSHQNAVLLTSSLLENIVMHTDHKAVGGKERVMKICRALGFSPYLMQELEDDQDEECAEMHGEQILKWTAHISDSDYSRLTLARALVKNPECLVIHKPAASFNDSEARRVLKLIRAHVDERGLELSLRGRANRRPRTVFLSSSTLTGVKESDQVYRICAEGIWPIDKDKVDERLLQ